MAEFKKLSEVDVLATASDNATVLVEEGGEIKRVPKKEVGGAGGYILTLSESNISDTNFESFPAEIICTENYDGLYDVLMAGGSAWVDMASMLGYQPVAPFVALATIFPTITNRMGMLISVSEWSITDAGLFLMIQVPGETTLCINILLPNGSHNLEPAEEEK